MPFCSMMLLAAWATACCKESSPTWLFRRALSARFCFVVPNASIKESTFTRQTKKCTKKWEQQPRTVWGVTYSLKEYWSSRSRPSPYFCKTCWCLVHQLAWIHLWGRIQKGAHAHAHTHSWHLSGPDRYIHRQVKVSQQTNTFRRHQPMHTVTLQAQCTNTGGLSISQKKSLVMCHNSNDQGQSSPTVHKLPCTDYKLPCILVVSLYNGGIHGPWMRGCMLKSWALCTSICILVLSRTPT